MQITWRKNLVFFFYLSWCHKTLYLKTSIKKTERKKCIVAPLVLISLTNNNKRCEKTRNAFEAPSIMFRFFFFSSVFDSPLMASRHKILVNWPVAISLSLPFQIDTKSFCGTISTDGWPKWICWFVGIAAKTFNCNKMNIIIIIINKLPKYMWNRDLHWKF